MKHILIFTCILISTLSFAGGGGGGGIGTPTSPPPSCATNDPAGNTCATATPICDLNGYCGSTAASYTADYWSQLNSAFCGSIENNSFLIFTASATTLNFNVWLTSSSTGDGIQIMVFSSAGNCSGAVTEYLCWSPGTGTAGPVALSATGLTPGNQYYIMIDGFAGDVAEYIVGVDSGAEIPVNVASSIGGNNVCLGETIFLTAEGGNGNYTWDPVPGLSATTGANVSITPTSAGTFDFTVTSATGNLLCPSSNQATTTIQVINCNCTIDASNSGDICPGGTADLNATTVTDASGYAWTGPNGFTATTQNVGSISPPTTPGTYDYIVTATVPSGTCASTTTIIVKEIPVVTLPATFTACNNEVIPETVLTSTPPGATYTWTNSNTSVGLPASGTGNIPSITASNTGNTVSTTTISVIPTLDGCVGLPESLVITVNPTPEADPLTSSPYCVGETVNIATFTGTVSGTVYDWTNSNSDIGLAASGSGSITSFVSTNTGSSPISGTIEVTPTFETCVGTPITFEITVNPLPIVEAGTDQTVCAGTEVTVSGSGAVTYIWDNGISDGTPFDANSTTIYTVTGTDANGCENTDQVTINVNANPIVNAGVDHAICIGASTTVQATGDATFVWDNGISDNVSFSPTSTTTYTVTGTDANGCVGTDQVVVTVNNLPNINAGADGTICANETITLSGSGGVTYTWNNGAQNGVAFTPPLGNSTYTVTGTDANGCVNTDEVTFTVLPVPIADFTADETEGYPVLVVNFTNGSQNSTNYSWNFGNGTTATGTSTSTLPVTYSTPGTYPVTLTASNGYCSDETTGTITVIPFPDAIITPPNVFTPNGDGENDGWFIDVRFGNTILVQIFNRWGNLMTELNNFDQVWTGDDASDGVYFYKYVIKDMNEKEYVGHGHFTLKR